MQFSLVIGQIAYCLRLTALRFCRCHGLYCLRLETLYQSLNTNDYGKMLWERKIYTMSPSIHFNLDGCVRANAISAENL